MISNNIKRYLSGYVNDTVTTITEDLVMAFNTHPHLEVILVENIKTIHKNLNKLESKIKECLVNSENS